LLGGRFVRHADRRLARRVVGIHDGGGVAGFHQDAAHGVRDAVEHVFLFHVRVRGEHRGGRVDAQIDLGRLAFRGFLELERAEGHRKLLVDGQNPEALHPHVRRGERVNEREEQDQEHDR